MYFDENGKILNNSDNISFPHDVMLYNKNYPLDEIPKTSNEFRIWLQNLFYKIDDIENIENIEISKNKIIVKPRLETILLTFIICIYPFVMLFHILFYKSL